MRCIKYSQNNPDSCGDQYSGFSSAFRGRKWGLKMCISFKPNTSKCKSDPALGTMNFITEWSIWFCHSRGCFLLLQNKKSFLDLSFSFHLWLNDSFNPARHCRKSTLIFSSGGLPCPSGYGFYPEAGGSLDVNCCYLIAVYNTQRGAGWIRGQGWSYRSVDERIWLLWKQVKAGINTSYSGW